MPASGEPVAAGAGRSKRGGQGRWREPGGRRCRRSHRRPRSPRGGFFLARRGGPGRYAGGRPLPSGGGSGPLHEQEKLVGRNRSAEEEPLAFVAPFALEELTLPLRLDALRDYPHSQVVGEGDDGGGDGRVVGIGRDVLIERAIDLQRRA